LNGIQQRLHYADEVNMVGENIGTIKLKAEALKMIARSLVRK
jgi:hypothetical protein